AEIVIVATGCHWATDGLNSVTHETIPGVDTLNNDWQLTPEDVTLGRKGVGHRVLVVDNEAYFMGVTLAQKLAGEGHEVHLLTQRASVGQYMDYTLEAPMMHRELHRLHVDMHAETHVERVEPGVVTAYNIWDASHKERFEVDTVVLCTARVSNDSLYRELKAGKEALAAAGVESLYLIGDASAPRMIVDCIFDGHRLAREIDSANPAIPLPFIRERRLWGATSNREFEVQLLAKSDMAPMA
ncbi:MAG: FAD-dependent oxidoreductase, partial [Actinomycetota bacterium]|nr:FAD-dependent oxidoreductase [Actinomycetota bacterium]